jgi:FkbM family methyltransferase
MKSTIKKLLPPKLIEILVSFKNLWFDGYSIKSYSQEGEDMILRRIFENQNVGFYVDVGAHHPFRFSNTYYFYKQGWHGINIDAMPGSMRLFRRFRSRDINLEMPISNGEQDLIYFQFNEPALNSFSEEVSRERNGKKGYYIQQEIKLKTLKLSSVLHEQLPNGTEIDFLSIDVEGLDLDILRSNDWGKYKPKIILVEILGNSLSDVKNGEISIFLKQYGYAMFAKTINTVFFRQDNIDTK